MVTHLFMQNKSLRDIFLWPTMIALLTSVGLVTALLFDDAREWFSTVAVAVPVLVTLYYYYLKPRHPA